MEAVFVGTLSTHTRLRSDFVADSLAAPEIDLVTMACGLLEGYKLELKTSLTPVTRIIMAKTIDKASEAMSDTVKESRDQLIEDLKRVIEDAQNLAEEAKNASGAAIHEKIMAVQKDLGKRIKAIRKAGGSVIDEVEQQSENVEDLIRRHPWCSVAVAALAGLLADRLFLK